MEHNACLSYQFLVALSTALSLTRTSCLPLLLVSAIQRNCFRGQVSASDNPVGAVKLRHAFLPQCLNSEKNVRGPSPNWLGRQDFQLKLYNYRKQ